MKGFQIQIFKKKPDYEQSKFKNQYVIVEAMRKFKKVSLQVVRSKVNILWA